MLIPKKTKISQETLDKALEIAAKVFKHKHMIKGKNPTGVNDNNAYEKGFAGQYHVAEFLKERKVKHAHAPKPSGKSEPDDILIYIHGTQYRLEIKTAGKPTHTCLAFPKGQRIGSWVIALVGVRLGDLWTDAEIMGILPAQRFREIRGLDFPGTRFMQGIEFARLEDFETLLERCDKIESA